MGGLTGDPGTGELPGEAQEGRMMPASTLASLDMRGKTITTFIAYQAAGQLAALGDGEALELVTDAGRISTMTSGPGAGRWVRSWSVPSAPVTSAAM